MNKIVGQHHMNIPWHDFTENEMLAINIQIYKLKPL